MIARVTWLAPLALVLAGCVCSVPSYTPSYWNDSGTIQYGNNCYNYSNNVRTDTFAQPGRRAGPPSYPYGAIDCANVGPAAVADGLEALPASGKCDKWWVFWKRHTKLALVIAPGWDYHWYRLGPDGMWTHKPGGTPATNLDNSGNPISNPETADRGSYTVFCGYYCSCSDKVEGAGHENIQ
jgi:hypothetical protein